MRLITWNIQWGLGVDGRVDLKRIIDTARSMADFDVLCLQEVSRNFPALRGNDGGDQFAQLAALLPGFQAIEGIAVDRYTPALGATLGHKPGANADRQQFGNMIFTRLMPLQILRHLLPWTADASISPVPTMPRLALEVVVDAPSGPLRVTTTHLEYYSAAQRSAQIEALRALQAEASSHAHSVAHLNKLGTPFESRPRNARGILTGDFNCAASDPLIARLQQPLSGGTPAYRDAWKLAHPGAAHAPTVGVFDQAQWQGRIECFDFIFVSDDIATQVGAMEVDQKTAASDHQPVLLEIDL